MNITIVDKKFPANDIPNKEANVLFFFLFLFLLFLPPLDGRRVFFNRGVGIVRKLYTRAAINGTCTL